MNRRALALLVLAALAASSAFVGCGGGGGEPTPRATATATPTATAETTDAEVILPDQPAEGYVLTNPSFPALPGAQAFFGQLGGTVYRIEMPDNWNGRLVLWAHGFRTFRPDLAVESPPLLRNYLIENGYAWAASSLSTNGLVSFQGAHETAALHDFFVQEFGQPEYSYITGASMGGELVLRSLELFPSRYDGALAFCGATDLDFIGHYLVLAAYAAGVTQEEFDAADSLVQLINERILPVLDADPQARALFESLVTTVSGGPRPFRHESFERYYSSTFSNIRSFSSTFSTPLIGALDNTDFVYPVDPASGVSADDLNAQVVRLAGDPQLRNADPNLSDLTGAVPVPLLLMHTTGDGALPFSGMQLVRRLADAAGNGDLLVQRAIRARDHCGFSGPEMIRALEDLLNWVENGVKPAGDDVLGPLEDAGLDFTDPLREGDPGGL